MPRLVRALRHLAVLALMGALATPVTSAAAAPDPPPADVYELLEDPEATAVGQEPAHAELVPYGDARSARRGGEKSPWTASLDGSWKIHMSDRPEDVPDGFQAEGYDTSGGGWRDVEVPHTWQTDGLDHPMFRNIPTEMYPDDPPKVPHDVNPTGAYVRTFELPQAWEERETFLRFEGVTSGYLMWVNGEYAGYDQGGYTPAEFDISEFLHSGRNTVAVQVHRWGSGAHLEDVDQWRFSGIFRSVDLYSTPATYLRDVTIRTDLDADYRDAELSAEVEVASSGGGESGERKVTGTLYDQRGVRVTTMSSTVDPGGGSATTTLKAEVAAPAKWTDETPDLYTLVLQLSGPDGTGAAHTTAQPVGFREIEVRDRQLLVNGERILIKGTNRAETDPGTGRHATRERTASDVALMKQLNINSVRTSHYPSDPYLYELADQQGLWIDDEVDIETHHHDNCPSDCLAERPEWQKAFMDRLTAMYERDKNHPSVFMWDTGNEAGLGKAHYSMADFLDRQDPGRPLYHQANNPDGDAPFADVWGPRYPSPASLEAKAKTTGKPIIMGEYAHAMGNSLGNFREFWDVVRTYPEVQGGYIWDWAEQNITQPIVTTPDSSGNDILSYVTGKPDHVAGYDGGRALALSGLDDFVEVYRDPRLDAVSDALTVDARVRPDDWTGDFTVLAKGDHSYALKMRDRDTLEFFVYGDGDWHAAAADVPADWYGSWHRVSGTFDGRTVRLLIDGKQAASHDWEGTVAYSAQPVNIGRNPETGQENTRTRMGHGTVDQVRVYHQALTPEQLAADPKSDAVLALDFDTLENEGEFLSYGAGTGGVDGVVSSDRTVQPEARAMAAVHAPLRISAADPADPASGRIKVLNERSFTGTDDLTLRWKVTEGAKTLAEGDRSLDIAPGQTREIALPDPPANPRDADRQLTVEAVSRGGSGHLVAVEQFDIGGRQLAGVVHAKAPGELETRQDGSRLTVTGEGFSYTFDRDSGELVSMKADGRELLSGGPELDAWRAPVSNEIGSEEGPWRDAGLDRLRTKPGKVTIDEHGPGGAVVVTVPATVAAPAVPDSSFDQTVRYTVTGSGELRIDHRVEAEGRAREVPYLPRIGLSLQLPGAYDRFTWYGRGPHENYNDREDGAPAGVYSTDVDEQFSEYTRPQDYGNHEDVRWASLSDGRGGLLVSGSGPGFSAAVTPFTGIDRAAYPFALRQNPNGNTLHLDHAVSGVSETFHTVLPEYQVRPDREYAHTLRLRPLTSAEARDGRPRGPVVCVPEAELTPEDTTLAAGESTPAELTVTNPCDTPLKDVTAAVEALTGWTAEPASATLGDLAAGGSTTWRTVITRGEDTPEGRRHTVARVSATSTGGARVGSQAQAAIEATPPPPHGDVAVSTLGFVTADNGWGPVERDTSNGEASAGDGKTLTIGGKAYERGLGVHADSTVEVYLGGNCTTFTAEVGLDDEADPNGSVAFAVYADGERVGGTGTVTNADPARKVEASVEGAQLLRLRVTDGGDGNGHDHADWAAATVRCRP